MPTFYATKIKMSTFDTNKNKDANFLMPTRTISHKLNLGFKKSQTLKLIGTKSSDTKLMRYGIRTKTKIVIILTQYAIKDLSLEFLKKSCTILNQESIIMRN